MNTNQQVLADGSHNINVQIEGDGNTVTVGRPHLTLIPPRNRARLIRNEIDLLNPYCRSIALIGREADMQSLWDWLHSPKPVSVRTLTGRAGAGKTRLAIELIERLNAEKAKQWWAGFVRGSELRRFAGEQSLADWGWARPTLVVVDYAASLIEPLREWLRDLAQNSARNDRKPLRLLLLEREAAAGEGWLQVLCTGGQSEANVPDLFDPLEPKHLEPLNTQEKRRAILGEMLAVAASLAECSPPQLPAPGQNARFDQQLQNDEWADPLYLMMAALLSLRSDLVEVLQLPRTELAMRLVDHEIKRLIEGVSRGAERLPVHLTAFAALGGGLTHELAVKVAEEESAALHLNYPGGAGALVDHVHEVLPAPDHGITSIVPDILAEALVLKAMKACSDAQQEGAILRAVDRLGRRVIPFIIRTIQDFAPTGEIVPLNWLERLIKMGKTDALGLLVEIEYGIPHNTLVLREKAVEVNALLAERLNKLAGQSPNEPILAEQSRLLNNLSVRLSALGRREEALIKVQEAVRICEQLAKAKPDAFRPDLATSLNTLAIMLSHLGRREEALIKAQDAAQIFEQLAEARPAAFLPSLAGALNNLAVMLSELGRPEEALEKAQEAARTYGQLAEARPDAFLPDLAGSLLNLANRFNALGRREEALAKAQEAVRIREQLARARPDAFLPDLAMPLNNLAIMLSNLGRLEEALAKAQEAVRISEQLAQARPDAFLPDLAMMLNNLANRFSALGRWEEALAKAQEAVRIYRQLAQARPDAFLPYLGTSLYNLAIRLRELGRLEEALARAQEAVPICEQLAQARPDACLPALAMSLNTLANILNALGRREEALAKAQEAVRIRGQLAQARPDKFLPELADSLNDLANHLRTLGQKKEALAQAQEAARINKQLAQMRPDAFLPNLALSLNNLAVMLSDLGQQKEALANALETERIYGELAQMRPDAFLPNLASSQNNLATILSDLGQREEALAKVQEAVRIYRQLAQARRDAFLPYLATSLYNLAIRLRELGRLEEALAKTQEALRVNEQLAQARPDVFLPDLVTLYITRGTILRDMENHVDAASSFSKGILILTPQFQKQPPAFAQLIGELCRDYIQACKQAKVEPDMAILAPVREEFERLKQNQPKE